MVTDVWAQHLKARDYTRLPGTKDEITKLRNCEIENMGPRGTGARFTSSRALRGVYTEIIEVLSMNSVEGARSALEGAEKGSAIDISWHRLYYKLDELKDLAQGS